VTYSARLVLGGLRATFSSKYHNNNRDSQDYVKSLPVSDFVECYNTNRDKPGHYGSKTCPESCQSCIPGRIRSLLSAYTPLSYPCWPATCQTRQGTAEKRHDRALSFSQLTALIVVVIGCFVKLKMAVGQGWLVHTLVAEEGGVTASAACRPLTVSCAGAVAAYTGSPNAKAHPGIF
jgi:hypothetical protein